MGKWRYSVPIPTPASRAMDSSDTGRPSAAAKAEVATWRSFSRFRRASDRFGADKAEVPPFLLGSEDKRRVLRISQCTSEGAP
nr:hypothetical protein MFLOJ_26940 [Mycobacterium florentinum]